MSTLNVDRIVDASGGVMAPISSVNKNRIINGAMVIDQRNAGAAITASGFVVDRFASAFVNDGAFSAQQDSSAPAGFTNSVKCTTTTADASLSASQYWLFRQRIEGYNVADLDFGTANAKTVTLSFWVRSSLTGTFGGSIMNSAANRAYPFTYTISVADTWEQKSVTIAGDTSGTWLKTNGNGMVVVWSLGIGSDYQSTANAWGAGEYYGTSSSTSVIGTLNATWYITGVQLEVGTQATSFEYRQYGTELNLCQRYFAKLGGTTSGEGLGAGNIQDAADSGFFYVKYPVTMRTAPTAAFSSLLATNNADYNLTVSSIRGQISGIDSSNIGFNFSSSGTTYAAVQLKTSATAGFLSYSAEL
jgi:hypothetical protein